MSVVKNEQRTGPQLKIVDPKEAKQPRSASPSPAEGVRLVHAFLRIKDPVVRDAIVNLAEKMSQVYDGRE
jgi:hypothetical protein